MLSAINVAKARGEQTFGVFRLAFFFSFFTCSAGPDLDFGFLCQAAKKQVKKAQTKKFTIDCSEPLKDDIFDVAPAGCVARSLSVFS